jgi:hypothetical protein
MTTPLHLRLEPLRPGTDLDAGFRARTADPVWFLARQWQLGEHASEDASSPVEVRVGVSHEPLLYDPRRPLLDPTSVPAEALVEAEPGDWWTIGRRVRLGRAALPHLADLAPDALDRLRLPDLPTPYEALAGEIDGRAVFLAGILPGHALWTGIPSPAPDRWSSRTLDYRAPFRAGRQRLVVPGHDGGDLDWFSADGVAGPLAVAAAPVEPRPRAVVPGHLSYPGAPNPRWWQIEDHAVDPGGFGPDRAHLGTMLLSDVALAHSDDWFWFPVPAPQVAEGQPPVSVGVVARLHATEVRDSFDEIWPLAPPPVDGPDGWSLFHTTGLDAAALVIWPVAVGPHAGPLLDEVLLGIDEDANLAWAIELRADGRQLLADGNAAAAIAETTPTGTRNFRFLPSTTLPPHWHPYRRTEPDRVTGGWQQGIVADLTLPRPKPRPGPVSRLIGGPSGAGAGRGHEIDAHAIASSGAALTRRYRLARDTKGGPVLWVERASRPLLGPASAHLRFDVLGEDPTAAAEPEGDGDG